MTVDAVELIHAVDSMATALHGVDTGDVWCKFTCGEVETLTDVLRAGGHTEVANFIIREHGDGDDDPEDMHHEFYDPGHSHA